MTEEGATSWVGQSRLYFRAIKEVASYGYHRLNFARRLYERWRPIALPPTIQSVLFVCKGNICRSPLAAVYFESLVRKNGKTIRVRSAGLETTPGKPAHSHSKLVAQEYELSLECHVTAQVNTELVLETDLIVVMEIGQKDRVERVYPHASGKVVLLGAMEAGGPIEIADPFGREMESFRLCFTQMRRGCEGLALRMGMTLAENGSDAGAAIAPGRKAVSGGADAAG